VSRIWAIAFKDLRTNFRTPVAIVWMLAAPLALASLLGLAFGGGEGYSIAVTKVAVVNLDEGAAAEQGGGRQNLGDEMLAVLRSTDLSTLLTVEVVASEAEARSRVDAGATPVALIIPPGFSAAVLSATGGGEPVTVYRNPAQTLGPSILQGVVQQVVDQFNGARAAAAAAVHFGMRQGRDEASLSQAATTAAAAFMSEALSGASGAIAFRDPQVVETDSKEPGVTAVVLSGMMVFFMFIAAANVARTILDEDFAGTLPRLFTTPTSRGVILAGKYTSVFLTVLAQAVILLLAGWLLFRIQWGNPWAVALLTLDGAAVSAGIAVFLVSILRTPAQAGGVSSGVFVTLALLGGNFVGTAQVGGVFGTVRRFTPNGWLLEAWDATMRGAGASDITVPLLVVLGFALATFGTGVLLFRRRYA